MLSHVHIGIREFDPAVRFYSAVLAELGWRVRFVERERPWAGWQPPDGERPLLIVGAPYNGARAEPGNGQMVALQALTRATVDRCYAAALANGGADDGAPGVRPEYHPDYYGAYVRDPDGNKLCICCHEPEPLGDRERTPG